MLILQALLLWLIVSTLILGGAMVFHRLFPEESPWFGFIIPPLALILLLNFIEHFVALPVLMFLLPPMLGGTIWVVVAKGWFKEPLTLPTVVFLLAFAFTFAVRYIQPNIDYTSDGISDLNMVNNFSQGQTLPPPDCWMPPFRAEWYYGLQHYAASALGRLLNVKIGVAYNVSFALLSALTCVVGAAAAHRISGGRLWITLAVPFLIESSATGVSAYLLMTSPHVGLWTCFDVSASMATPHPDGNWLWNFLLWDPRPEIANLKTPTTLRLQVPGFWTWRSEYHANAGGHLLTLFAVLVVAELVCLRKTMWPWIMAVLTPLVAVVASTWALPITALLCWVAVPLALICGRRPASINLLWIILVGALTLLWPAFYNATSSPEVPPITLINPSERAPLLEFLVLWWPILALLVCACFSLRQASFGVRWVMIVVPLMLIGIELITIDSRYNTIEKMWGYTWGAGLVTLFPFVASRPGVANRIVIIVLLASGLVTLSRFSWDVLSRIRDVAVGHLDGSNYLMVDDQKRQIFNEVKQVKHGIFLSGKSAFCYNEAPAVAVFTGNKSYIAWYWFESLTNYQDQADYRQKLNDDFYAGQMPDRLRFLHDNKITGVLIWPDDDISDDALDALKRDLDPSYEYIDCRGSGDKNAGVFLLRPLPGN
jgi:hypothetical protein